MADSPRRLDDDIQTIAGLRRQLDALQATVLSRLATHTHPGGGGGTAGVSSVSAADSTISVAGTATNPTVRVASIAESQVTSLVSDLASKETAGAASSAVAAHVGAADPHPQYVSVAEMQVLDNTLGTGESTVPRFVLASTQAPASGALCLTYFTATRTETVSQVRIPTGSTAAGATPTTCLLAVYSEDPGTGDLTRVGVIANDTTLFGSANTEYTRSFASTWTKVAGQRYAFGLLVVSGAALPTFNGPAFNNAAVVGSVMGRAPRVLGQVTGQTTMPTAIAATSITSPAPRMIYAELLP